MINQVKPFVLYLIIIVLTLSGCVENREEGRFSSNKNGWEAIRPPYDVMSVAVSNEFVYAGGKEGLYRINKRDRDVVEKVCPESNISYVRSICFDNDNRLWIGSMDGLYIFDDGKITPADVEILPDKRINYVTLLDDGKIAVGTWGGAVFYDKGKWSLLTTDDGLLTNMVNFILKDSDSGMWFGSNSVIEGGITYIKNGSAKHFTVEDGLPHCNVSSIIEDKNGTIWVGGGLHDAGGVACITKGKNGYSIDSSFEKSDQLYDIKVRSMYEDFEGNMWFGFEYDGVLCVKGVNEVLFTKDDGLSHNEVKDIVQASDGSYWIGTRDGITYIPGDYKISGI